MTSSPSAAQRLAEFTRFCAELKTEDGTPFALLPFQKTILKSYFAGTRELAVLLPKKNGKSSLMAALALYHLVVTPNAECIIVAASREQAEIILRQSRMFIKTSDALSRLVSVLQRSILSKLDEGRIRVLAADADTADGVIPTLAIVDELHRHRTDELYGVMRDGLGPRHGQIITISTAGATMNSPLGRIRDNAYAMPTFRRTGMHNYAQSDNGMFAFHEWCLGANDDPQDMKVVKQANPAPWHTIEALRERHDSESMTAWTWLRFACGVWTEGEEPWTEPSKWDSAADRRLKIEVGSRVILGVDVDARAGESSFVLLSRVDDQLWTTSISGQHHSLGEAEDAIRDLAELYDVETLTFMDRGFERSAEMLEAEGMNVVMLPDSPKRKEQVAATLFKVLEEGRLRHDGDREFRAQVLAGRVKESESGWRFVKDPNLPRPINALIALAAAVHVAETETPVSVKFAWT